MFLNKIGFEHVEYNINNQDFGFEEDGFKCVVDGCSEGLHSEVGSKLFCELYKTRKYNVNYVFKRIFAVISQTSKSVKNYMCFTILTVKEHRDKFVVKYCGDGYIIKEKLDGTIQFEKIDDGEYPKYYAYNYLSSKHLSHYQDGVDFTTREFSKSEYKNVGVASDGLRYIFGKEYENEFINLLSQRKISAIKRLINREHKHFKDDITIVF